MNVNPDVSIIVTSGGDLAGLFANQTLRSLEVVSEFEAAAGTWVLFAPEYAALERHIVKNLLLAAELADADIAVGAVRPYWLPTTVSVEDLSELSVGGDHSAEIPSTHVMFNREWLSAQTLLVTALSNGLDRIQVSALHEAKIIVAIAQEVIAPKVRKTPNPKNAKGSPFKNLPALAFYLAKLMPLKNEVLFDVEGGRAVDSELPILASRWRVEHPKVHQHWVAVKNRNSFTHAWHLGRARWLVVNEVFRNRLPKREGQIMVVAACSMPLLRVGRDNPDWVLQPTSERRPAWSQVGRWDLACVASPLNEQILRSSTAFMGDVIHASIFGDAVTAAASDPHTKAQLALRLERPVLLLAFFTAQSAPDLTALADSLHDTFRIVAVTDDGSRLQLPEGISQVTQDLAKWLAVSDLLITDWSVLTLEFGRLQRPIIALQPHRVDVVRRRGSYVDLMSVLPGPVVQSVSDVLSLLQEWLKDPDSLALFKDRRESFAALAGSTSGDAAKRIWSMMVGE